MPPAAAADAGAGAALGMAVGAHVDEDALPRAVEMPGAAVAAGGQRVEAEAQEAAVREMAAHKPISPDKRSSLRREGAADVGGELDLEREAEAPALSL